MQINEDDLPVMGSDVSDRQVFNTNHHGANIDEGVTPMADFEGLEGELEVLIEYMQTDVRLCEVTGVV